MNEPLTSVIEENLKWHIRSAKELPYALTLKGIAAHFDASMMPARLAVEKLLEENYLMRQENGRLAINPRRRSRAADAVDLEDMPTPQAPPDRIIADHVMTMSLHGDESFLREEAIAEQFEIGRTVLRRIFTQLASEGILQHVPRRGWHARPFREKDMVDYLVAREAFELKAIELAQKRFAPERLHELLKRNSPDHQGQPRLDNSLHQYWIQLADNRYIDQFFKQQGHYHEFLFAHAVTSNSFAADRAAEHREILSALIHHQWDSAAQLLSHHIRSQCDHVAALLERVKKANPLSE